MSESGLYRGLPLPGLYWATKAEKGNYAKMYLWYNLNTSDVISFAYVFPQFPKKDPAINVVHISMVFLVVSVQWRDLE